MFYWIGSIGLLLAGFLVFRVFVHREYQSKGKLSIFSAVLETMIFALHANLPYLYLSLPWPELPPLPENRIHSWTSLAIISLGTILVLGCMRYLRFSTSLGQGSKDLRKTGPYRWSRNPQILAYGLVVIGFASLFPSIESIGWILLYMVIAHMMVVTEEAYLRKMFGGSYQAYCAQVPRYIKFKLIKEKQGNSSEV